MYTIRCEPKLNRIYIHLEGFFTPDEMKHCVDETIVSAKRLKPGYEVVTDISLMKPGSDTVAKEVERAQAHFVASGAKRGVRVVGPSVVSGMQFTRTGTHAGYHSVNVGTMVEAEAYLKTP